MGSKVNIKQRTLVVQYRMHVQQDHRRNFIL
jgi:hypothetical protein